MVTSTAASAPVLSVLIANYNGADYLREALDSILAQTFADFELLLLDDGSTDASLAIARSYDDARIVVHALPHRGLAQTLNHGLTLVRAPLVARMDSDDVAYPERFTRQLAYLSAHPEVVALGTQARHVRVNGSALPSRPVPSAPAEVAATLPEACGLYHSSVVMRADVVRRVGGYRPAFGRAEDYDLWLRLSELGAIANLPDVLLDVRRHDASVSVRHRRQQTTDSLAAQFAALCRRTTGVDPFVDFAGRFERRHLIEADVPESVRVPWAAIALLAAVRYGHDADPELVCWHEAEAEQRLSSGDALFRERLVRARFTLARQAFAARDFVGLLGALGHAVRVSPRLVAARTLAFARRRKARS